MKAARYCTVLVTGWQVAYFHLETLEMDSKRFKVPYNISFQDIMIILV